jgi:splicing factor 3B subunit 3
MYGNFSAPKAQELVVARGGVLELLRPNEHGKLVSMCAVDTFGAIRALAPFRLTGASRDYVVVGSDSGRVVILDFNKEKGVFVKVGRQSSPRRGMRAAGGCREEVAMAAGGREGRGEGVK